MPQKSVFASKVWFRCGFAAGCEARLCLAVQIKERNRAMPLVFLLPHKFGREARTKGAAHIQTIVCGEAEPRLTSGGKAARKLTFESKPCSFMTKPDDYTA